MNAIKKITGISASLALLLVILSPTASAGDLADALTTTFTEVICSVAESIFALATAIAALVIIAAAGLWVYSKDDAGKRNAAKVWIMHAIIGLIIILVARSVVTSISVGGTGVSGWCAGINP